MCLRVPLSKDGLTEEKYLIYQYFIKSTCGNTTADGRETINKPKNMTVDIMCGFMPKFRIKKSTSHGSYRVLSIVTSYNTILQ